MPIYTGTSGSDSLSGGSGPDELRGGPGDDSYFVSEAEDLVVEAAGEGTDRIFAGVSYALAAGASVETLSTNNNVGTAALTLTGNELANNVYGNYGSNSLFGGGGNDTLIALDGDDTLNGGTGIDSMSGGLGNDNYYVDAAGDTVNEAAGQGTDRVFATASYTLAAGVSIETLSTDNNVGTATLTLTGNELANNVYGNFGNNSLHGGAGNDTLIGLDGDDTLNGGLGIDSMTGGLGNDWFYVDTWTDIVSEAAGQGTDRIFTSASYTLATGLSVETLSTDFASGTAAINLTGNELANNIYGNYGNNNLKGGGGNDILIAHDGNDILDGGAGADVMIGGLGNDSFEVDSAGDVVSEAAGQGYDRVAASVSYTLAAGTSVESLQTASSSGTSAINLVGNEFINSIIGNSGANLLDGGGGNDTLSGSNGDDTIIGGAGTDWLIGGLGNDNIYVDAAGDAVQENSGQGLDRVFASTSYALGSGVYVETLSTDFAGGTAAIDLTGNDLDNAIYGNFGNNRLYGGWGNDTLVGHNGNDTLDGGGGVDSLVGGLGNDSYYVHGNGSVETVIEAAGEGDDRVFAYASYQLAPGAHVETLSTTSLFVAGMIDLTGNELANNVYGNHSANVLNGGGGNDTIIALDGNDTLDGGTGVDSMSGGLGNDNYYVDAAGDTVSEAAGQGTDRIFTSVSYTLAAGISIETLSTDFAGGTAAINLSGNELANNVYGNYGNNGLLGGGGADTVIGLDGNDTLDGGLGADSLAGGSGADVFSFTTAVGAGNIDAITDFEIGVDRIRLAGGVGDPFAALATGDHVYANFFVRGAQALAQSHLLIYNPATGALLFDADGSGGGAAIQFATLAPNLNLSWSDFEVSGPPNAAPTISSSPTASVAENSLANTIVYQATANNEEGDRLVWWLEGPDASYLTIDESGAVRLLQPANYETKSTYNFTVVASDSAVWTSKAVQLTVENVAEPTPVITEKAEPNDDLYGSQVLDRNALIVADNPNLPNDALPSATIAGNLSGPADRDYFGVYLNAGEVIYLDIDNTAGNLDAYLELYRVNGGEVLLLSDDDLIVPDPGSDPHPEYGHNTDSFIRIRVADSGTYFFAVSSFQDPERPTSGSYELHVSIGPPATAAEVLEEDVQALLSGLQWNHTNLTYGFPTSATQYPSGMSETDEAGEFSPLTAEQQTALTSQFGAISAVSGLTFAVAADAEQADLRYGMSSDPDTAHAHYPTNQGAGNAGGTVWFNKTDYLSPTFGNYAWLTFLHETGHALGLKHGHESPPISQGHDSLEYSVMTYRSYVGASIDESGGFTNETWGFPQTLMMLDIAALQQMYGANFATNSGDTTYGWNPTTGEMSLNGTGQGAPGANRIFMTLWDGGGTDTYDLSNYSTAVTIDLRPGEWTRTGAVQTANLGNGNMARGNIANALQFESDPRSLIENAIGGSGADTLIANAAANRLTGNTGADIFRWDTLEDLNGLSPDVVVDFQSGTDQIDLSRIDGEVSTSGDDYMWFIGTDAFSGSDDASGELRYEIRSGQLFLQGDNNSDGLPDFEIMLTGASSLTSADFLY